jgi:DNA-binding MarR family transcriptional regulator
MTDDALDGAFIGKLRACLDAMGTDVARTLTEFGLTDYRPRFSAVLRVIGADGPSTIRHIAARMNLTHSAASQTVSDMASRDLVQLRPGADARERIVQLTDKAEQLRPMIDAEWTATAAAMRELGSELSAPLATITAELAEALERRSFHDRIAAHLDKQQHA